MKLEHQTESTRRAPDLHVAQMEQLLQFQRDALEMVALGAPTDEILNRLCDAAEVMMPESLASVMMFSTEHGNLTVRAAPSLSAEGADSLDGLQPGPLAGSCGTAVFSERAVFVGDIDTDPRWDVLRDVAQRFALRACWSMPIRATTGEVLGTFALTSHSRGLPSAFQRRLLDTGSYLAGIVLERETQIEKLLIAGVAFDHMREAVMVTDEQHRIVQINRSFEEITGYAAADAVGETPRLLHSERHDEAFYKDFYWHLEEYGEWRGEIWNRRRNGEIYPQLLSVQAIRDEDGRVLRHVSVFADITDIKTSERKLWQLAHYDTLTGLPNRLLLNSRLDHAIHRSHRKRSQFAVLFIDLDRFKNINDSMGHQTGDDLLTQMGNRLSRAVQEGDTVARLGGDEFVILLEDVPDANAARRVAERIVKGLAEPMVVGDRSLFATASVGISLYPRDATAPETLLQHADAAMYKAKALGRNRVAFYAPELTAAAQHRLDLEHDLRRALLNDEFIVYYQPQFAAASGEFVGVEALVRWRHPTRGLLLPDTFIPVAEETRLICDLGCWVAEQACSDAQAWFERGMPRIVVAVNLSPYQLTEDCASKLQEILQRTGFPPQWLEFEVTESTLVGEGGIAARQLTRMRDHFGVKVAMDDFGTGHSSLAQLKSMPVHKLKIDRSFVCGLPHDENDVAIAQAIIAMAHTLGLRVVAEGVETAGQHTMLADSDCDEVQGFLYAHPMPAEDLLERFLHNTLRAS